METFTHKKMITNKGLKSAANHFFLTFPVVSQIDSFYSLYVSQRNPDNVDVAFRSPILNVADTPSVDISLDWVVNGADCGNLCESF